ncbi:MAG: hypothetical protein ACLR8P_01570 [Clostridium fessum]
MAVKSVQAVINGTTVTLTYNSSNGKYEATVTAPAKSSYNVNSGHYYPVTVKATDEAGNTTTKTDSDATLGVSLKLKVKEKVAPTISISSPTAGSYLTTSKPSIIWTVTDARFRSQPVHDRNHNRQWFQDYRRRNQERNCFWWLQMYVYANYGSFRWPAHN